VHIRCAGRPAALRLIETLPYPGFPTDMQAQFFALSTISKGSTMIVENVFENRFRHAGELIRMGADITVRDRMALIHGVEKLTGAAVSAYDLRGGAALVMAGLAAEGATRVDGVHYIDRGYEALDRDLTLLGADITRI
jgi:UDP-N-acetylglucosamine 1-carboxyvinyltransferase